MWIKCSEQMPEPFKPVLIAYDGKAHESFYDADWHYWVVRTGKNLYLYEVEYWMPMPEVPRG